MFIKDRGAPKILNAGMVFKFFLYVHVLYVFMLQLGKFNEMNTSSPSYNSERLILNVAS